MVSIAFHLGREVDLLPNVNPNHFAGNNKSEPIPIKRQMSSESSCVPGIVPRALGCDCDDAGCALASLAVVFVVFGALGFLLFALCFRPDRLDSKKEA